MVLKNRWVYHRRPAPSLREDLAMTGIARYQKIQNPTKELGTGHSHEAKADIHYLE